LECKLKQILIYHDVTCVNVPCVVKAFCILAVFLKAERDVDEEETVVFQLFGASVNKLGL
jgi:hypothetical protein